MSKPRTRLVATCALVLALVPGLAGASSWTWSDTDDQDRPLSISSVASGHLEGESSGDVTLTFDQPLVPEEMGPKDFVVVVVESDGEAPNEEWVYLVAHEGRLQRVSYNPHSDESYWISDYTFGQTAPETLQIQVSAHYPGHSRSFAAGSYTESAPGCAGGCWDWAPDDGGLIHDWTPPWVRGVREPSSWTYQRTLTFYWEASDYGLSGFRRSSLMISEAGSEKWRAVATRGKPGRYKVLVRPLNQGSNVMLRPVARDGAGNKAFGPVRRTRVPWDQGNPNGPGTLAGSWREEMMHAFGGTVHVSTASGDSLSFPGTANLYCFHGWWGPDPVRATFEVGGRTIEIDTTSSPSYSDGYPKCIDAETVEERTATLTVHEGRLTLDWYWSGIYPPDTEITVKPPVLGGPKPAPAMAVPKAEIKSRSESARAVLSRS